MRSIPAAIAAAALLSSPLAHSAHEARIDMASRPASSMDAGSEVILVPSTAKEPILLAAHHAYTVWSQQFMGALLEPEQTDAWREFQGMDIRLGDAYRQMGQAAYQEGRLEDAIAMLTVAADFLPEDADLYGALGYCLKETGKYEFAVERLERATQIKGGEATYWLWLGDAYRLLGNYEESYRAFMTARDVAPAEAAEQYNEYVTYTEKLMDLAPSWDNFEMHRDFQGRHDESGRVFRQVEEFATALKVMPPPTAGSKEELYKLAWVYLQMGTQYAYLKLPNLAADYYLQSMDAYTQSDSASDLMRVHQNLALCYDALAVRYPLQRSMYLERSASEWSQALDAARTAGDAEFLRHTQGGLLAALAGIRPLDDAKVVELRASLAKEIPWRGPINDYSIASATRGEIACRLVEGDLGGARTLIEMADPYYKDTGFLVDLEYRAEALTRLGEVYLAQDHAKRAGEFAQQAIDQVNALRKFIDTDGFLRSANPETLRQAAAVQVAAALHDGSPEQAFEAAENYQVQLSQDLLGARVHDEAWRTDFATEERLLLEREGWFRSELEKATAARDTERVDWLTDRQTDAESRVRRLGLSAKLPPTSKISYRKLEAKDAMEAQAALPPDVSLLHFLIGERGGSAVVMSGSETKGVALPDAKSGIVEDAIYALRAACDVGNAADVAAHAARLRELLLDPLAGVLPSTGSLAVSGDQATLLLPVRLLDPDGKALPVAVKVFYTQGVTALSNIADVRRGKTATGLDAATGASVMEMLAADYPAGGARVSIALDLDSEDPTMGLWSPRGDTDLTNSMLTGSLLALDFNYGLLALDLELSGGRSHAAQQHFASIGELAWRSGCGVVILNQWPVSAESRDTFFNTLNDALLSSAPLDAFQLAQDAVRLAHPDSNDWAAFAYLGAP